MHKWKGVLIIFIFFFLFFFCSFALLTEVRTVLEKGYYLCSLKDIAEKNLKLVAVDSVGILVYFTTMELICLEMIS